MARLEYGARGGPFKPGPWGASTCKGGTVYLFVMDWPDAGPLRLPPIDTEITTVIELSVSGPAFDISPVATAPSP